MDIFFILLALLSALVCFVVYFRSKEICFRAPNILTDNEKMLSVVSSHDFFSWPSSLHNKKNARCQLREFWVIGLYLISKLFNSSNRKKEIVNVALSLISHFFSSLIGYFILKYFFGVIPALFGFSLYAFSIWGYQVSLYLGHIIYSQFWCLLSIFCLTLIDSSSLKSLTLFSFLAGILLTICFASSSASRKFPPMIIIIYFILSKDFFSFSITNFNFYLFLLLSSIYFFIYILKIKISKKIFTIFYSNKKFNKEIKKEKIANISKFLRICSFLIFLFVSYVLLFLKDAIWLYGFLSFLIGILLMALIVLLPKIKENFKLYLFFLNIGKWGSHFLAYPNSKKTFGFKLPPDFRGEGFMWIPKFLFRIVPIPFILALLSLVLILFNSEREIHYKLTIIFIGILPTLLAEITKSIQVAKAYFPSFIGIIVLISAGVQSFAEISERYDNLFIFSLVMISALNFIYSLYIYYDDVYPSRMYVTILRNWLKKNKIFKFSTYKNPYNDTFVKLLEYSFPGEFNVQYVKSISDVKKAEGIFIVPPITSKSLLMECDPYAIKNGDLRLDKKLNNLLNKKKIEKFSLLKLKTLASSKIYVNESEVTSFRFNALKQITDEDRWLGLAWVLDLNKTK